MHTEQDKNKFLSNRTVLQHVHINKFRGKHFVKMPTVLTYNNRGQKMIQLKINQINDRLV